MELLGLTGAYLPDGEDAMPALRRLASRQEQLGMWAAPSATGRSLAADAVMLWDLLWDLQCCCALRPSARPCIRTAQHARLVRL